METENPYFGPLTVMYTGPLPVGPTRPDGAKVIPIMARRA